MTQDRLSRYLARITALYDGLVRYGFYAAGVLVMALALSIGVNVVMRWLFDDSLTWIVEGGEYILLFVTFLASAHILHENGHARMLLLVERLNPSRARLLNLFSSVLGAIVSLVLAWVTTDSTLDSIRFGNFYRGAAIEVPQAALWWVIPFGFLLLAIEFTRQAVGFARATRESAGQTEAAREGASSL